MDTIDVPLVTKRPPCLDQPGNKDKRVPSLVFRFFTPVAAASNLLKLPVVSRTTHNHTDRKLAQKEQCDRCQRENTIDSGAPYVFAPQD